MSGGTFSIVFRGFSTLIIFFVVLYAVRVSAATLTTNVTITGAASVLGTLSKGSGTFVIDHPLDPANKLLFHSFLESPDVKNIYDGIATLDSSGEATIVLPNYFLALNKDFRYLATPLGAPMPNLHLGKEIQKRWFNFFGPIQFKIVGGAAGGRVSWQITGIRHDKFIEDNPIVVEVEKSDTTLVKKGEYVSPELYAQ